MTIFYHVYLQQYGKYLKSDLIGFKATHWKQEKISCPSGELDPGPFSPEPSALPSEASHLSKVHILFKKVHFGFLESSHFSFKYVTLPRVSIFLAYFRNGFSLVLLLLFKIWKTAKNRQGSVSGHLVALRALYPLDHANPDFLTLACWYLINSADLSKKLRLPPPNIKLYCWMLGGKGCLMWCWVWGG